MTTIGSMFYFSMIAAESCQKTSTAGAVVGFVIILAFIGGLIALAIANARARSRLATANAELGYLRPEVARLQQWMASGATPASGSLQASPASRAATPAGRAAPASRPAPPQWHPDPSGRHEYRLWDGTSWTDQVSDGGVVATDPPV